MEIGSLGRNGFAAEVEGLDFAGPADRETREGLRQALVDHSVLCLRSDGLSPARFLAVAGILGVPQVQLIGDNRHPEHDEISFVASRQTDRLGSGKRIVAGLNWHTDDSYLAEPCWATMLYANIIPQSGGDTLFCDLYAALAALPGELRTRIEGRCAEHAYFSRRNLTPVAKRNAQEEAASPPARHPVICTHPLSGRETLYLNPNRIGRIVGIPEAQGDLLLDELYAFVTGGRFIYRHQWRRHDIVIWDNRCTMHKASADYGGAEREMWRILLQGEPPR